MGKRSDFKRIERDYYPTPYAAVKPLIPHLKKTDVKYICEPCAGDGRLIDHLEKHDIKCVRAMDIEPKRDDIYEGNCLELSLNNTVDAIITNPPWSRKSLHPMIEHFIKQASFTWLLFDSDWAYTKQARPYLKHCSKIVTVGRLKWIEDSKFTGKDNCAWYCFRPHLTRTEFFGQQDDNL